MLRAPEEGMGSSCAGRVCGLCAGWTMAGLWMLILLAHCSYLEGGICYCLDGVG